MRSIDVYVCRVAVGFLLPVVFFMHNNFSKQYGGLHGFRVLYQFFLKVVHCLRLFYLT